MLVWSENEWAAGRARQCTATMFGRAREALMALGGGGGIGAEPYHRAAHLTNLSRDMHFDGLVRGNRKSPRVQQQAAAAQPPPASRAAANKPAPHVQHAAAAALHHASRPLPAKRKGGGRCAEFDSAGGGQACAKRPAATRPRQKQRKPANERIATGVTAAQRSDGRRKEAQQHVQTFMRDSSTRLRETCSGSDRGGSRPRDEMIGRAAEVVGKTAAEALQCTVVKKGVLCQYRRDDLVYDLKMGRLGFEVLRGGEWQAVEPANHSQGRRKQAQQQLNTFLHDSSARLRKAGSGSSAWLRKAGSARSGGVAGKTVAEALRGMDATTGTPARYRRQDLVYDLKMGRLGFETLRGGVWQAVEPV